MEGKNSLHVWLLSLLLSSLVFEAAGLTEEEAIQNKYIELYNRYEALDKDQRKAHPDVKIEDTTDDDHKHANRGTLSTLAFLAGNSTGFDEEIHVDRPKLRKFLARVGYLQTPGSLILLDKYTSTLRLLGCQEKYMWVMQGENDEDDNFEGKVHTGDALKIPAPSSHSYIHKYTCYHFEKKRSHVFYVIQKPFPELPLGLQVAEGKDSDEWEFTCSFPYCFVHDCEIPIKKINYHRRNYPPYAMKWDVPPSLKKALDLKSDDYLTSQNSPTQFGKANVKFVWENLMVRKEKDSSTTKEKGFVKLKPDDKLLIDAFGERADYENDQELKKNAFYFSRLAIKKADLKIHDGPYECIVIDANGVASVPPKPYHQGYQGKANVHVMPSWQRWAPFVVAIICCILVALIILICPKKMEYDDGTPYTKDELVAPGDIHTSAS